jgi:dipeptidase
MDDPENCVYSPTVISLAVEKGYYDPKGGEPFRYRDAYCPATPRNQRYASARVWSLMRRAAPSMKLSADYHRAVPGAEPYPLWIKPDKKLSMQDVMSLMRDHYEGTPFDMRQGVDAGPYHSPNRNRPIEWEVDGETYVWERPISTQQTGFSFISESRSWLPDPVGGVLWYGFDDTYVTCWVPFYCGIDAVPDSYQTGSLNQFSWDSAWWTFNFVGNYATLRYSDMIQDVQSVQGELEGYFLALQPAVEKTALALWEAENRDLLCRYLTDYSIGQAERTVKRWRALGEHLVQKYNDGYVQDEHGRPHEQGYEAEWLRRVVDDRPAQFKLPENTSGAEESELID